MKLERAIEIVLELARENILTEGDARDNDIEDERNRQFDACAVVEDFAVKENRLVVQYNFTEEGAA
tara:strand:- start:202 stop:399 length:198 start_codon:yes stop_codon:yes gene_type:complete